MSTLSRDHKRSLISAPLQTLITAGVSFLTVYYLVRAGGVEALGLWAIGNLAILYGGALVLGAHQKIARDFAHGHTDDAVLGLRSFAGTLSILSALTVAIATVLSFTTDVLGGFDPLSVVVLVLSGSFWTLGLLARGPALYLGQFSQSNILEASSSVLAFALTLSLVQAFGAGPLQIWLPFLARSLSLLIALLLALRQRPEIVGAFGPHLPNMRETLRFFKANAGTSALWLTTASRMLVLRTFFGASLGPSALGLLDVATRVPTLLVNGVSSGNQTLLVGLSTALTKDDHSEVISLLDGLSRILLLINLPLLLIYCAYADIMFDILIGSDVAELTMLTWLATSWVAVTAINQIAFWIVQSAGLEARQAGAYLAHTALFALVVFVTWQFNAMTTFNLIAGFAAAGIVSETLVLWGLAATIPSYRAYLASPAFKGAVWALIILIATGILATLIRGVGDYVLPAILIFLGWLLAGRVLTRRWPLRQIAAFSRKLRKGNNANGP